MICNNCGETTLAGGTHACIAQQEPFISPVRPVKCDICGSTTIDHTQTHCELNSQLNKHKKN